MSIEIERKFLVSYIPEKSIGVKIKQGYLQSEKNRTVRVRTTIDNSNIKKAFITIKGAASKKGISRYEFEQEIPFEQALNLFPLCDQPLIEKTRYIYINNNEKWEIDDFHGENEGLLLAEIELNRENQKVDTPDFILSEVTGIKKYYNSMLQKSPYKNWGKPRL